MGFVTLEVYTSSVRTRAFGCYIADGCCSGVAVKRGSTLCTSHSDLLRDYPENH